MAKRELSSTLRNLKFMQRAAVKVDTVNKEEKEVPQADGQFPSVDGPKKCIVIMEGDPHPGDTKGRMSFLSFNPSVDKLNGEASSDSCQPEASGRKSETIIDRVNGSLQDEYENPDVENSNCNEGLKRKQVEAENEAHHLDKSQKNRPDSSPQNSRGLKKQHKEKLDWNVLRPSNSRSKKK